MTDDVRWLASEEPHPARQAQRNALARACAGDRAGWLALWAEDGWVEDPIGGAHMAEAVGPRPGRSVEHDQTGEGRCGQ